MEDITSLNDVRSSEDSGSRRGYGRWPVAGLLSGPLPRLGWCPRLRAASQAESGPAPDFTLAERESLVERGEAVLTALRDLDSDHTMGKLEAEDCAWLRQALLAKGAGIMAQRDEQAPTGTETRALAREERACPTCGQSIHPGDVFCAGCGLDLSAAQTECHHCGRTAAPWDLFRRNCGAELAPALARPRCEGAQEVRP